MRHVKTVTAVAAGVLLTAGGCAGTTGTDIQSTATTLPDPGKTWSVLVSGSATPSPTGSGAGVRSSATATASKPSASPSCTKTWPPTDAVLIPIQVTPISGGFKVEWPRQYDSRYRVTAVHQKLVAGAQPEPAWKNVPAGTGCTVSTTITGLTAGEPYIVWLDAPDTGFEADGTRHLYSGRSGVVYPR